MDRPSDRPSRDAPIDFAALDSRTFGDRGLVVDLLGLFLDDAPALAARIAGGDAEALALAHRLCGAALAHR